MAQVRMTGSLRRRRRTSAGSRCARSYPRTSGGPRAPAVAALSPPSLGIRRDADRGPQLHGVPSTANGSASASRTRSTVSRTAPEKPPTSVSTTTNSSPPRRATRSRSRTQPRSRRATSLSAASPAAWPWRVVDRLEAVEVEHDDPDRPRSRPGTAQPRLQRALQRAPVGEAGERIGLGLLAGPPVALHARGHVLARGDRAVDLAVVVGQRVGVHLDPQERAVGAYEPHEVAGHLLAAQRAHQRHLLVGHEPPAGVQDVDRAARSAAGPRARARAGRTAPRPPRWRARRARRCRSTITPSCNSATIARLRRSERLRSRDVPVGGDGLRAPSGVACACHHVSPTCSSCCCGSPARHAASTFSFHGTS